MPEDTLSADKIALPVILSLSALTKTRYFPFENASCLVLGGILCQRIWRIRYDLRPKPC